MSVTIHSGRRNHANVVRVAFRPDRFQEPKTMAVAQRKESDGAAMAPAGADGSSAAPAGASVVEPFSFATGPAVAGGGDQLPHYDTIQRSFGAHDVSGVRAHVGGAAAEGARGLGAIAYATGNDVAFASTPDLATAAHEAAHVVQQRAGVSLAGGMDGGRSDPHERHADAVAALVVRGESAEALLDQYSGSGGSEGRPVQRIGNTAAPEDAAIATAHANAVGAQAKLNALEQSNAPEL